MAIRTHVTWWSCNNFPDRRQPDGLLDKMGIGSLALPAAFLSSPNFFFKVRLKSRTSHLPSVCYPAGKWLAAFCSRQFMRQ